MSDYFKSFNNENFESNVLKSEKTVLVDFGLNGVVHVKC